MAEAEVVWTEEARRWLQEIWEYIAEENPSAAEKTIEGLYNTAQLLARYPELGYKYQLSVRNDVRVLLYGHYRIAYTLTKPNTVNILGIFHAALDIDRYFSE
jgi:toxin ParE1/3/4